MNLTKLILGVYSLYPARIEHVLALVETPGRPLRNF
jgi:hypothetical protein